MSTAIYYADVDENGVLCVDNINDPERDQPPMTIEDVAAVAERYSDTIYFTLEPEPRFIVVTGKWRRVRYWRVLDTHNNNRTVAQLHAGDAERIITELAAHLNVVEAEPEAEPKPHRHMWRFQKRAYKVVMAFKCEGCGLTASTHENRFWGRAAYYRFHRRYVGGNGP